MIVGVFIVVEVIVIIIQRFEIAAFHAFFIGIVRTIFLDFLKADGVLGGFYFLELVVRGFRGRCLDGGFDGGGASAAGLQFDFAAELDIAIRAMDRALVQVIKADTATGANAL